MGRGREKSRPFSRIYNTEAYFEVPKNKIGDNEYGINY
jgi:hypothetical protein